MDDDDDATWATTYSRNAFVSVTHTHTHPLLLPPSLFVCVLVVFQCRWPVRLGALR